MNFYFTKRICVLTVAILLSCFNSLFAQCSFQANEYTSCASTATNTNQLNLVDNSSGLLTGSTRWAVTLPPPSNQVINESGNQFTYGMAYPGQICVTMTDTVNNQPCSVTECNITIYPNPVIKGAFSTDVTCIGACVHWNDSSIAGTGCTLDSFLIDWAGNLSTNPAACFEYSNNGIYSPAYIIVNSCGCRADTTFVDAITVTAPPSAAFTGAPLSSCTSPLVSTMTVTSPAAGATYTWYVSSTGTFTTPSQSGSSTTFVHSYTTGTYSVMLIASYSSSGCVDTTIETNYVQAGTNAAACFTSGDTSGCDLKTVNFTPCSSGADYYNWYFIGAPGSTSMTSSLNQGSGVSQNVYYYDGGTYTTEEVAYYPGGCTDTAKMTFTLGALYNLNFAASDTSFCQVPNVVCVTYTGQACPSCTFAWSPLPNSNPASDTGTCYTITSYGSYSVELQVTDTTGCQTGLIKTNYIKAAPLVPCTHVSYLHGRGCANDTILVVNCTTGGPFSSVAWGFPGGNVVSQDNDTVKLTYSSTGCNDYSMIVRTQSGCIDTIRDSICIGAKPSVSLSVMPNDLCFQTEANVFSVGGMMPGDTPTAVIVWPQGFTPGAVSFNIGTDSLTTGFNYIYQDYGNFSFCYVAEIQGCLGDTVCDSLMAADSVYIYPPIPKLKLIPICTNVNQVVFVNQSLGTTSYFWTYNGTNYPNQDSLIIPTTCGAQIGVELTAINDTVNLPAGCTLKVGDTITVPCFGTDFKFYNTAGCAPEIFSGANIFQTILHGLVPTNVLWSVQSQGSPPVFSNDPFIGDSIPEIAIENPGTFEACVQLTYPGGCIDTLCKPNYIDISQPTASFTVNDTAGCVPFCVQFTNTSTDLYGAISHFYWNFGDTASVVDSINPNPSHCFDTIGQFQVCLKVVDTNGCPSTYCRVIQANIIHANFTETDSITCTANSSPLNPITYTNSSTGYVAQYQWILPPSLGATIVNGSLTSPSIELQYANQGYDNLCLVATDITGTCFDTVCKPVHVANPIANYGIPNLSDTFWSCPPAVIRNFTDSSQFDICQYYWDFGDGLQFSTDTNAGVIYTYPGNYCVKHVVTSCHGCEDSITKYCVHIQGPTVSMTASTAGGCPCLPVTYIITSWEADSMQFNVNIANNSGAYPQNGNAFIYFPVSPVGTQSNPTYDTLTITYCGAGIIIPKIVAIDATSGCEVPYDSLIIPIGLDTPSAAFTYNVHLCGSDSVCFTNTSTFAAAPYAHDSINVWDFGDGTFSNAFSPCHVYATPGDYAVTLSVTDNFGCTADSVTHKVHVPAPPAAAYTISDSAGCVPFLVPFIDSSTVDDSTTLVTGQWNFGNGGMSGIFSGSAPQGDTLYNYIDSGTYVTSLIITDGYGCRDTATHTIIALAPPYDTVGPNQTICRGSTTTLYGSGSQPIAWITNYNISDTSSMTPVVSPTRDTFYILKVGSPTTCYKYDTVYIFVDTIAISLDTATNLCRNELTTFTASAASSHGSITSYNWTFGDGSAAATGQTVTHQYGTFGSYTDTLIVVNNIGCRDTDISPVTIYDIPHAAMSVSDTVVCLGTPITLTNLSTAGASAALTTFYFGLQDGLPNATTSPYTFIYPNPGSYEIILVQMDANQCLDSAEQNVTVHALPQANFNNDTSCVNVDNTYTSSTVLGDGSITTYDWTVNGTDQGVDTSSIHYTFPDSSVNTICLAVTDVYGCMDTTCKPVAIFSNPQITVAPLDATVCLGYSDTFTITGARFSSVQWVPSAWVSNPTGTTVVITPLQTIRYQVYGYYLQCQPAIDTVSIYVIDTVPVTATADPENIVLGLSSNVTTTVQGTIDSIVWDPDSTLNCRNCRNPIATPHETTTYYATVYYSKNGVTCSNRTSVTITVYQSCDNSLIYVPNTFTPDNINGKNTVFRLQGIGIQQVNYFRVYDRWGKLVYQAENETDPNHAAWNGGLNNDLNRPENSGVFVYVFEIECVTGQTVTGKGNITLIR